MHGHEYTDKIGDYPKEVLEEVEQITRADKLVYQTGTIVASGKVIGVDSIVHSQEIVDLYEW